MEHVYITDHPEVMEQATVSMSLRWKAKSYTALNYVNTVASRISDMRKPTQKQVNIVAAIIADLLKGAQFKPIRPCFRPMGSRTFTDEPYGETAFRSVFRGMQAAGYLKVLRGITNSPNSKGWVTRVFPSDKLLTELSSVGITPRAYRFHFEERTDIPLVAKAIVTKTSSTRSAKFNKVQGVIIPSRSGDNAPKGLREEVESINEYLRAQEYGGMVFEGLFRCFSQGDIPTFNWDKGARLYAVGGGYQSMRRDDRGSITINGEAVAEVDISASHLRVFHALEDAELPDFNDPYQIDGIERDAIKRFVTSALGLGKVPRRWANEGAKEYEKWRKDNPQSGMSGDIYKDYPFKRIEDATLKHIPLLSKHKIYPHTWADLQYHESEVMLSSIIGLMRRDIPTLPLHDSLICQESHKEQVMNEIQKRFQLRLKHSCVIKYK